MEILGGYILWKMLEVFKGIIEETNKPPQKVFSFDTPDEKIARNAIIILVLFIIFLIYIG